MDSSYEGLFRALQAEKESIKPVRLEAIQLQQAGDLWVVQTYGVQETHEQWEAAGDRQRDGSFAWEGRVLHADEDQQALVLRTSAPPVVGTFYLRERDFLRQVRSLAEVRSGQSLPGGFRNLEDRRFMAQGGPQLVGPPDVALRPAQGRAVRQAGRPVSLVWGPPGTGKTYTLGAIAAARSGPGRRLLVLAPTNIAVDRAVLAIDDAHARIGRPLCSGQLIRPGFPALRELEARPHLLHWTEALAGLGQRIREVREVLHQTLRNRNNLAEVARVKVAIERLVLERSKLMWQMLNQARIVATTLSSGFDKLSTLTSLDRMETTLIVDEASMIPRYALIPFLDLDFETLILFGDPKQLGPVFRNDNELDRNAHYWVSDSLFELVGAVKDSQIQELEEAGCLSLLDQQSRMHAEICEPVSRLFYQGRLQTIGRVEEPPLFVGGPTTPAVVCDALRMPLPAYAPRGVDRITRTGERKCEWSAWIALELARRYVSECPAGSVLMISPFRAQADILRKLARVHLSEYEGVTAGTVHTGQGSEADLVIFDPVVPDHVWLMGTWRAGVERLFCVAYSRPRRQIITLARADEVAANPFLRTLCGRAQVWAGPAVDGAPCVG